MICFEVSLNGKVVCTAGVADGLLDANLVNFGNEGGTRLFVGGMLCSQRVSGDLAPKLRAALQHPEPNLKKHLQWITDQMIGLGDEITLKIVDRLDCDPPR
jgi:hypothetical protein